MELGIVRKIDIDTEMQQSYLDYAMSVIVSRALPDAQRQKLLEQIPAGRLGEASEIAAVVTFLASDAAAYITGETIHVNGGMYMC